MLGCVIAMDSEAELLLKLMRIERTAAHFGKTVYIGTAFGCDVALVISAEGKVNAAAGTCAVLAAGADAVLNFGVAGGLRPETTEVCGVYLIEKVVQYDFDLRQLTGKEVGTLPGEASHFLPLFCPAGLDLPRRTLGTGDRFDDSPDDHALLVRLGCDVREMEAGAIAQVCKCAGVPFTSVKAISDVYGSGSTTEMYRRNLKLALMYLRACLPELLQNLS